MSSEDANPTDPSWQHPADSSRLSGLFDQTSTSPYPYSDEDYAAYWQAISASSRLGSVITPPPPSSVGLGSLLAPASSTFSSFPATAGSNASFVSYSGTGGGLTASAQPFEPPSVSAPIPVSGSAPTVSAPSSAVSSGTTTVVTPAAGAPNAAAVVAAVSSSAASAAVPVSAAAASTAPPAASPAASPPLPPTPAVMATMPGMSPVAHPTQPHVVYMPMYVPHPSHQGVRMSPPLPPPMTSATSTSSSSAAAADRAVSSGGAATVSRASTPPLTVGVTTFPKPVVAMPGAKSASPPTPHMAAMSPPVPMPMPMQMQMPPGAAYVMTGMPTHLASHMQHGHGGVTMMPYHMVMSHVVAPNHPMMVSGSPPQGQPVMHHFPSSSPIPMPVPMTHAHGMAMPMGVGIRSLAPSPSPPPPMRGRLGSMGSGGVVGPAPSGKNRKTKACRHFLSRNNNHFGNTCDYIHPCRLALLHGRCKHGRRCTDDHVCASDLFEDKCREGPNCKLIHLRHVPDRVALKEMFQGWIESGGKGKSSSTGGGVAASTSSSSLASCGSSSGPSATGGGDGAPVSTTTTAAAAASASVAAAAAVAGGTTAAAASATPGGGSPVKVASSSSKSSGAKADATPSSPVAADAGAADDERSRSPCPFWFEDTKAGCKAGPECPFEHKGQFQLPSRPTPTPMNRKFAKQQWEKRTRNFGKSSKQVDAIKKRLQPVKPMMVQPRLPPSPPSASPDLIRKPSPSHMASVKVTPAGSP